MFPGQVREYVFVIRQSGLGSLPEAVSEMGAYSVVCDGPGHIEAKATIGEKTTFAPKMANSELSYSKKEGTLVLSSDQFGEGNLSLKLENKSDILAALSIPCQVVDQDQVLV